MNNEINKNPDILNCLANLSSDEVFTPPELANKMLDMLPQELFESKNTTFLDPCSKSGVFLREIAKRLIKGLEKEIPDLQERVNWIMSNQLYGVPLTDLTAKMTRRTLYCSRHASGKYSIVNSFDESKKFGNILSKSTNHSYGSDGKCKKCGVSKEIFKNSIEKHAYYFIHANNLKEMFNVKFDVIIGNPPYQVNDGGGTGSSAMPLYHKFVETAVKLNPRYLIMIIPSRWFVGGKGLDDFRNQMLNDSRLRVIHDFYDASECFPGVEIKGGVCYFLWNRDAEGLCNVISHQNGKIVSNCERPLLEKDCDVFIRFNEAISIYKKVSIKSFGRFSDIVSTRKPYGIASTYGNIKKENNGNYRIYGNKTVGYINSNNDVLQGYDSINKYKVFISFGYGAGEGFPHQIINKPFIGYPGDVCTETYLMIGAFEEEEQAKNTLEYMKTKFFRFMVMLKKNTQNGTKQVYDLVPKLDMTKKWTDSELYSFFNLSEEEIEFIDSMIKPME